MPFFQGAYNFAINNANMYDVQGNLNQTTTNIEGGNHLNVTQGPQAVPYHLVDPYTLSIQQNIVSRLERLQNVEDIKDPVITNGWPFYEPADSSQLPPPSSAPTPSSGKSESETGKPVVEGPEAKDASSWYVWTLVTDVLPRQIYLHLLLRLPSLYFTRFNQILSDANLSLMEMKDMALRALAADSTAIRFLRTVRSGRNPEYRQVLPPAYQQMKERWELFIDGLLEEWRTLNLVSALLVPGILTMFQIAGAAPDDPVTRYLVFWSLLSALVSLLYGCMFVVQFSRMRNAHKMVEWAVAVQNQGILWNVPVMLAMPLIWLTWSIVVFIISIMWFMWRATAPLPDGIVFSASPKTAIGFRIFLCVTLGISIVYGILIFITFQKFGKGMDDKWKDHVEELVEQVWEQHTAPGGQSQPQGPQNIAQPSPIPSSASTQTPFHASMSQMPYAGGSHQHLGLPSQGYPQVQSGGSRRSRHSRTPSPNSAVWQNQYSPER
ncbi:hypothetical protein P691DRAFT_774475 [Macrolepiota fuliginosa MF-IS2]|uniref:Uncharacterized protein n=1 Tax=Macrolepiota fuliginosa MF-IS2 TaxID=1400762 RepID=A0A9P5XE49_9AGAR|nr:hypothetical protein P691DRAFT_774475 [Macrolepiota fuliginosa MF-IS2]